MGTTVFAALAPFAMTVEGAADATTKLSTIVTPDLLSGVLDEVVALLPVCIPVMIGFIALRKGISFVQSILHAA